MAETRQIRIHTKKELRIKNSSTVEKIEIPI